MVARIRFKYKHKKYILEYTRDSIVEMERQGFDPLEMLDKPVTTLLTMLPDLFAGAFIANHPTTPRVLIDKIYSGFDNKIELLNTLAGMYSRVIDEIVSEVEKVHNGVQWEMC